MFPVYEYALPNFMTPEAAKLYICVMFHQVKHDVACP